MQKDDLLLPSRLLKFYSNKLPGIWKNIDRYRADPSPSVSGWDPIVFMPVNAWHDMLAVAYPQEKINNVGAIVNALSFLAPWRPTQDIVTFDVDFLKELVKTPITGELPSELFLRIPAWSIYIDFPGIFLSNHVFDGFFAGLQLSNNRDMFFVCFYFVNKDFWVLPITIPLGGWPLDVAIDKMNEQVIQFVIRQNWDMADDYIRKDEPGLHAALNVLMYICAYGLDGTMETTSQRRSAIVHPKRVKGGWRLFPPPKPVIRHIGDALGSAIRQSSQCRGGTVHGTPRPHIRRAHWHGYWHGSSRDNTRRFVMRWLPPIPVAMSDADSESWDREPTGCK